MKKDGKKMKIRLICFLIMLAVLIEWGETGVLKATSHDDRLTTHSGKNENGTPARQTLRLPSGEKIHWEVISSGGDIDGKSMNFRLSGTVGQTATGSGNSDNFGLNHGFWQEFAEGGMCGDANGDGAINIADAVYLITYIFKGGLPPDPLCIGDANGDGSVNVADAVYLVSYIFKGGPPPVEDCCL